MQRVVRAALPVLLLILVVVAASWVGFVSSQPRQTAPTDLAVDHNAYLPASGQAVIDPTPAPGPVVTEAEPYVASIAYRPGTNNILFTANRSYPNSPALFERVADPVTGALSPIAAVASGLPAEIDGFASVETSSAGAIVLETNMLARIEDAPLHDTELLLLSPDGSTISNLTANHYDLVSYILSPGGNNVALLDKRAHLDLVNTTTGITSSISTNMMGPEGQPAADYDFSADATNLAILHFPAPDLKRLSLVDVGTGQMHEIVTLSGLSPGSVISRPLFSQDGAYIYYVHSLPTTSRTPGQNAFTNNLYKVATAPNSTPVLVTDLQPPSGSPSTRVTYLLRYPSTEDLIFTLDHAVYSFNFDTYSVTRLTPTDHKVTFSPRVTETAHGKWLAYVTITKATSAVAGYYERSGRPLKFAFVLHQQILP